MKGGRSIGVGKVGLSILFLAGTALGGFRVAPYIQNPSQNAITVSWFSDDPGAGKIVLRRKDAAGAGQVREAESVPVVSGALPFHHEVRLVGLAPDTSYGYAVFQDGEKAVGQFRTQGGKDRPLRFIVYGDCETEPESTGKFTQWDDPAAPGRPRPYLVDQTEGYRENLKTIVRRKPDFVVIAGDLVAAGGEQRDWDEFWRQNAVLASSVPIFPALGNHEYFGGVEPGRPATFYSERAIEKYKTYFDLPGNGAADKSCRERYYAFSFGPVGFVVLDTNRGMAGVSDYGNAPDWNPGSAQYIWLEKALAAAQRERVFTFVMFHQCPYSSGPHGLPLGTGDGRDWQSGRPLRALTPLFMKYGVDALLCGHDEMYEHSVVQGLERLENGEPVDHVLHILDVGVGGDGLRGSVVGASNACRTFLAHRDAPEIRSPDGVLIDGGKHYGHLEVNVAKDAEGRWEARMDMAYVFPITGKNGHVSGFERRLYNDTVVLEERQ